MAKQQNPSNRVGNKPAKPAAGAAKAKSAAGGKPGNGLFGWLGRQVGHVKKAVQANVTKPKPRGGAKPAGARPPAQPPPPPAVDPVVEEGDPAPAPATTVLYREDQIEEAEMPNQPGVKLRRTIIDEVIVEVREGAGPQESGAQ